MRRGNPCDLFPARLSESGQHLCRWCGKPLSGRRTSYCNDDCKREVLIRCMPSIATDYVERRDHGICAKCGVDTILLYETANRWYWMIRNNIGRDMSHKFMRYLQCQGWPANEFMTRKWWDADHIVPVIHGGGLCGLDNYQTLCVPCHKKKTTGLAAERARERARQ